jgi:multicomponent Na+:H+ antiporter subunit A
VVRRASGVPETFLVAPATWAVYGDPTVEVDLYLFREVNAAFILSLVTFAVGFVLYLAGSAFARCWPASSTAIRSSSTPAGTGRSTGSRRWRNGRRGILQSGVLQRYMVIIFLTLAIGMGGRSGLKDALGPVDRWTRRRNSTVWSSSIGRCSSSSPRGRS